MNKEVIFDAQTGEKTVIEYTPEEIAEIEKRKAEQEAQLEAERLEAEEKENKKAEILASLGLTKEQLELLLG